MAAVFEQFAAELATIVEEDASELPPQRELGTIPLWDSLAIVTFMALASEQFDRILDPQAISAAVTVEDLFKLLV